YARRRPAAGRAPSRTDRPRPRALQDAAGDSGNSAVVYPRAGRERSAAGSRPADHLAAGVYARALRALGRKPGLGLVYLAPALLRRALPGLALRSMRRDHPGRCDAA